MEDPTRDEPRRRVLVVAPPSSSLGEPGVERAAAFAKHLPAYGWNATVLTAGPRQGGTRGGPLLDTLEGPTEILRARSVGGPGLLAAFSHLIGRRDERARRRSARRLARFARWLLVPDSWVGWIPFALGAARKRVRVGGIDAVYTTSPPESAHLLGLALARQGLPWIADFREPWTRGLDFEPPTPFHRRLHGFLEGSVLRAADGVVVTSERAASDLRARYPALDARKIVTITEGFEEEDGAATPPVVFGRRTLVHTGRLAGRGTIEPFLSGMAALAARDPGGKGPLSVLFVGPRDSEVEERVLRRGLAHSIRFLEPLPPREILRFQRGATALLLLQSGGVRGGLVLPRTALEYLAAGRRIVAIVPDGAVRDLLDPLDAAIFAAPTDPVAIASALEAAAADLDFSPPPPECLESFSYHKLAGRLAAFLDQSAKEHRNRAHGRSPTDVFTL